MIRSNKLQQKQKSSKDDVAIALLSRYFSLKENSDKYVEWLRDNGIEYIRHYTSIKNIGSIKAMNGIFSYDYLMENQIAVTFLGSDYLSHINQRRNGLTKYVFACFCDGHPMFYKKKDIVCLIIDINVVRIKETLFSNMNSDDKQHNLGPTFNDLQQINIFATQNYFRKEKETLLFKERQAEVLVPNFIPIECILNINDFD